MSSITSLLGLDVGDRYIGMAVGTGEPLLATRFGVIDKKTGDVVRTLQKVVQDLRINTVVVGRPRNLDGHDTEQTERVFADIATLQSQLPRKIEIKYIDETLTSVTARERLHESGESLDHEHAEAAKILLEDYIRLLRRM